MLPVSILRVDHLSQQNTLPLGSNGESMGAPCQQIISRHSSKPNLWHGALSTGLIFLLSTPFLRRVFYEVYLRTHQFLAVLLMYSIWQHLQLKLWPEQFHPPQLYVYIPIWTFLVLSLVQFWAIVYRNGQYARHIPELISLTLMIQSRFA